MHRERARMLNHLCPLGEEWKWEWSNSHKNIIIGCKADVTVGLSFTVYLMFSEYGCNFKQQSQNQSLLLFQKCYHAFININNNITASILKYFLYPDNSQYTHIALTIILSILNINLQYEQIGFHLKSQLSGRPLSVSNNIHTNALDVTYRHMDTDKNLVCSDTNKHPT